ncbi:MAG TPA: hypothetical protein VLI04_23585 [Nocardioidaceae bacterium]|nr:hypothetical protein [Nocardioidaceae bacterium]
MIDWIEVAVSGVVGAAAVGTALLAFKMLNGRSGSTPTRELVASQDAAQLDTFPEPVLDRLFPSGGELDVLVHRFGDRRELALHLVRSLGQVAKRPGSFEESRTVDGVPVLIKGQVKEGAVRLESVSLRMVDQG